RIKFRKGTSMIGAILGFFISAATIYLCGKYMAKVHVRDFRAAVLVALVIVVFNFLIGWLLAFVFHVLTLGVFFFTGLSFVINVIVNAIIIEIADKLMDRFHTEGFLPSLWVALILGLV